MLGPSGSLPYACISRVFEDAAQRLVVVGWDFDTRISLERTNDECGESLGAKFLRIAKAKPKLQIDILKWNFGALKQFTKLGSIGWLYRWWRQSNIDFRFDDTEPTPSPT